MPEAAPEIGLLLTVPYSAGLPGRVPRGIRVRNPFGRNPDPEAPGQCGRVTVVRLHACLRLEYGESDTLIRDNTVRSYPARVGATTAPWSNAPRTFSMTPPRLVQLECPRCRATCWTIDSDFRGSSLFGEPELPYEERTYECPACRVSGTGYTVLDKSPAEFFLQPHQLYPMKREEFDRWVAVLREHIPDHPSLRRLGTEWYPGRS